MLSIVLCGAVTSAYPSNVQITQSADNLTSYNYSSGNSTFSKKTTDLESNQYSTSKVYLRMLQSTGNNSNGTCVYDKFSIYQKPAYSSKWCMYSFNRIVTAAKLGVNGPEDNYRIYKLQNLDLTKPNPTYFPNASNINIEDLTIPGNWEKAIQIGSKTAPLIGGMHGYEQHVSIDYYADNTKFTPKLGYITVCDQLKIVVVSDLLDPDNCETVVATTNCEYLWNGEELLLNTTYNWKVSTTVYRAYAAMFPVKRDECVSTIGQIDGLPQETLTLNRKILRCNSGKGTTWNYVNNLKLSLELLNPEIALANYAYNGDANNGKTYFNNVGSYNKLYITRVHSPYFEIINNTTIWNIESRYRILNDYTVPMSINSTDPTNGAFNVATNKKIKFTFRKPIKAGSSYNQIVLRSGNGKEISINKTISGYTLIITPYNLNTGVEYKVIIPETSINDLTGNKLSKNYTITFVTDNTPPMIRATDPYNNATNIPVEGCIKVLFNEPIKFGTNYLRLKDTFGMYIPIKCSINGNLLTITSVFQLSKNTKYTVTLHTRCLTDLSGNAIEFYSTNFTTDHPPSIICIDPYSRMVNVPINKNIKVLFNEPIKFATNYIELKDKSGRYIPIKRSIKGKILTIVPILQLAKGTTYTLILHRGCINDLSGNMLSSVYSSNFTTDKPPVVTAVDPVNNAINVPRNKVIKILFSEAIKEGNNWIELKNSNGIIIPLIRVITGKLLLITSSYIKKGKYTVVLHKGSVKDLSDNELNTVYITRFTTV